jgi:phosphoenolpyruvate phosphomutase
MPDDCTPPPLDRLHLICRRNVIVGRRHEGVEMNIVPTPIKNVGSRAARLRSLLVSDRLEFLMEAHNGLSARIVQQAGFGGIWASGLAISAQYGVRDNNEASWTQVLEMLEFMADASNLPILLDGDTGYGNFNNVRRLVRKLEQRGIAGVCIEDKQFPKTNSFIGGERQPLAEVDEFCGKIKAGKDAQSDPDFSLVARVEALIAGWGMDEALHRAEAYRAAGADAILIHSKLSRPDEILEFMREWGDRGPVVIVPTKYYSTPTEVFRNAGVGVVIWANHLVRAATTAMESVAEEICTTQTLVNIEDRIAPVSEIFRLQGADEYARAERIYLTSARTGRSAIILAASRGTGLEALTAERPKVMLPVAGKPLLRRLVDAFKHEGVNDITVVGGYRAEAIDIGGISVVVNERYDETSELGSLACAMDAASDASDADVVVSYGDLLFRSYIVRDLLASESDFSVVVDSGQELDANPSIRDFARCSAPDDRGLFGQKVLLEQVTDDPGEAPHGRWIGLLSVRGAGMSRLRAVLAELRLRPDFDELDMPALLNALVERGESIEVQYVHGHWRGVNDLEEFRRAGDFAHGQGVWVTTSEGDRR